MRTICLEMHYIMWTCVKMTSSWDPHSLQYKAYGLASAILLKLSDECNAINSNITMHRAIMC